MHGGYYQGAYFEGRVEGFLECIANGRVDRPPQLALLPVPTLVGLQSHQHIERVNPRLHSKDHQTYNALSTDITTCSNTVAHLQCMYYIDM